MRTMYFPMWRARFNSVSDFRGVPMLRLRNQQSRQAEKGRHEVPEIVVTISERIRLDDSAAKTPVYRLCTQFRIVRFFQTASLQVGVRLPGSGATWFRTTSHCANAGRGRLTVALLRRAAEFWPELFIITSVAGFAYIVMNATR